MKRAQVISGLLWVVLLGLALGACGGQVPAVDVATTGSGDSGGQPQPAGTPAPEIPDVVPILPDPIDLKVTSNGSYITYDAATTVPEATQFYQEQFTALGWEQRSRTDSGFGDSITLLRSNPDYNISVTLQSVAGGDTIRVLITLIPK